MFGYVVINKPELKIKDYDKYQEYYCGLCQSLKQNHGRRGQLTLNYDLNFVGILLSSLYEPTDKQYLIRCPLHPFHKKSVRTNHYMDYVSDMNIVLTYYKLEDDVLDENSLKSLLVEYKEINMNNTKEFWNKWANINTYRNVIFN